MECNSLDEERELCAFVPAERIRECDSRCYESCDLLLEKKVKPNNSCNDKFEVDGSVYFR